MLVMVVLTQAPVHRVQVSASKLRRSDYAASYMDA